jgi:hypothetical protein
MTDSFFEKMGNGWGTFTIKVLLTNPWMNFATNGV